MPAHNPVSEAELEAVFEDDPDFGVEALFQDYSETVFRYIKKHGWGLQHADWLDVLQPARHADGSSGTKKKCQAPRPFFPAHKYDPTMNEPRLQFSIRSLLLTVAAVAIVLCLMLQVQAELARQTFVALVPVAAAVSISGLVYGSPVPRAFCIGALVPLGMMLVIVTMNLPEVMLSASVVVGSGRPGTFFLLPHVSSCLGTGFLAAIASGYLCVAFRWFFLKRKPPS